MYMWQGFDNIIMAFDHSSIAPRNPVAPISVGMWRDRLDAASVEVSVEEESRILVRINIVNR